MTTQELDNFLKDRPALNLEALSREGNRDRKYLRNLLKDKETIPGDIAEWLLPLLIKYGLK